jgi:hypothetical protein
MSARTPKVTPNPFDYLFEFEFSKTDTVYVSHSWERELGSIYHDQDYWIAYTFLNYLYLRERFINAPSIKARFNQFDMRFKYKFFSVGYALKNDLDLQKNLQNQHRLVIGINYPLKINGNIDFKTVMEGTSEFRGLWDYSILAEANVKCNDFISIFIATNIFENNRINNWWTRSGLKFTWK